MARSGRRDGRNGFRADQGQLLVTGDAPPEKLREVVVRATERSAVYDMVANGVPVGVDVTSGRAGLGEASRSSSPPTTGRRGLLSPWPRRCRGPREPRRRP